MTTQQGKIVIKDINLGGISDSRYSGTEGSVSESFALDIHSEPGVFFPQFDTKDDRVGGDSIDERIISILPTDTGEAYLIGTTKFWKRSSLGVYSLVGTLPTGGAYGPVKDAEIFNGDIYYAMQERVGKYTPGDSWSARDDDFRTIEFDNFHPMIVIENDLYVGYTNHIGKIEPGATTGETMNEVLSFPDTFIIESLGDRRSNLVVGTRNQETSGTDAIGFSRIYEWNLRSDSWDREQVVPEFGISAFMSLDGAMLFNAGDKGMLYSWDGGSAQAFKRVPGDWSEGNSARIYKRAAVNYENKLLFGFETEEGQPVYDGIYSLGGYDAKYPKVFSLEFLTGASPLQRAPITSMGVIVGDLLFGEEVGSTEGVRSIDKIERRDSAYMTTRNVQLERDGLAAIKVRICYRNLNGQTPQLKVNKNNEDEGFSGSSLDLINHENKGYLETKVEIKDAYSLQLKLILPTNGLSVPEIENLTILI